MMDYVHFLNIEYLLLRAYNLLYEQPVVSGAYSSATSPAEVAIHPVELSLGVVAIAGMVVTVIFLILVVIIRIRLEAVEHEGFHAIEEEHAHEKATHEGAEVRGNARWEKVLELSSTADESSWRLAILEADIMLGDALKEAGYRGEGVGERLRDANPLQLTTLDLAWEAHKVRNDVAHAGSDYHLSEREANATIDLYRRVFEELKII